MEPDMKGKERRKKAVDKAKSYGKVGAVAFVVAVITDIVRDLGDGGSGKSK
jgi:hypothetical protein